MRNNVLPMVEAKKIFKTMVDQRLNSSIPLVGNNNFFLGLWFCF